MHISINIFIPKYILLGPDNVPFLYVFRADCFALYKRNSLYPQQNYGLKMIIISVLPSLNPKHGLYH